MTNANDSNGEFYYADGKKIPLIPSREYVAVRPGTERYAVASMFSAADDATAPRQIFDIPEYNLSVIQVGSRPLASAAADPGISPTAADQVRAMVHAEPRLNLGPQVYTTPDSAAEEGLIVVGEILLKFKPNASDSDKQRLLTQYKLEVRLADYPEPGALLVAVKDDQNAVAIANQLHENELVEYAQPNFVRLQPRVAIMDMDTFEVDTVAPAGSVGDPNFASQWALRKIKAPEAWDISMGSAGISVAVIDEGVDLTHEDLAFKLPGYDALTRTDNPTPQPSDAHGTACSGVVAAVANNGRGGAGVAPNCLVLPVRIARSQGRSWITTDAQIADGIRTAVNRGADVLSNSWGGGSPSTAITSAFQYAQTNGRGGKGCPIAIAAANDDLHRVAYPANLSPTIPGLLAVGASNEWDQRKSRTSLDGETWWGSNYGPEIDVVAPGVHIFTTDISGMAGYAGGNYIPNFNGTSSATPHVAGLMALILSVDPDLRSWEVEDIIKLSADELGAAGRDDEFGFGRINCRRALEAASRIGYEISVVPEFLGSGLDCYMRINVRMYNPGVNTVRLDGLTLTSHTSDWSAEIDRFEYRPEPGGVMAARSSNQIQLNRVLLKANGNQSSWNYRWGLSWGYTFWRPGGAGFPMAANTVLAEGDGRHEQSRLVRGSKTMAQSKNGVSQLNNHNHTALVSQNGTHDNSIAIERQNNMITITIR